jgi:hypothetical protein
MHFKNLQTAFSKLAKTKNHTTNQKTHTSKTIDTWATVSHTTNSRKPTQISQKRIHNTDKNDTFVQY